MLRSVKYGLYGAVLAAMVGGTIAWTTVDKTVNLVVDGQSTQVHTTASDVGDVLRGAGYTPDSHDILAPNADTAVKDGSTIVFKRGRLLHLNVNGKKADVWTTAPTVADAMAQLGYSTQAFTSVSRSQRLPLGATDISVRTPVSVTVVHDGLTQHVSTADATVGQLLHDLAVVVGPKDKLSVAATGAIKANEKIVLQRVRHGMVTEQSPLAFPTTSQNDAALAAGQTQVLTAGATGVAQITYDVVYVDGKMVGKTKIKTVVLRAAKAQVVKVGTKPAPVVAPAAAVSPGSAQAIAQKMIAQRGWGSDQFNCLVVLWDHESGWNTHSANGSGAYGIPQALPGSKMASAGSDWQNSATTQITWGLGYITARYGTPCGAWSVWQGQGWY
ncbi:MAG: ubiquitin-like domain-containing protein [Jatrophihabitantaceae bacterium]